MIQDFQSAKRMHQLAKALDMTDAEFADMMQQTQNSAEMYRQAHLDTPFDVELPDGTHARSRDEVEEWYAARGERI